MKKKMYKFLVMILFIFTFFTTYIYATNGEEKISIRRVEIASLETPELDATIDKEVTIKRTDAVSVSNIVWYKNGRTMFENTFDEPGTYMCRIYMEVKEGYMVSSETEFMVENGWVEYAEMGGKPLVNITFIVKEPTIIYPNRIIIGGLINPKAGNRADYDLFPNHPDFYTINKVEWYKDNAMISQADILSGGTYKCRVYINLLNGFTLYDGLLARIGSEDAIIITTSNDTYVEAEYFVEPAQDECYVSVVRVDFPTKPSFGIKKNSIIPEKVERNDYYDIDEIVWYKESGTMYEDTFRSGSYRCRVFFKFINGGYTSNTLQVYMGDSFLPKTISSINGRYYAERTFYINQPYITTFKFTDLNLPEFGGIQDNKVTSLEPGMYSTSMVYWYKDDKFMSNVDTFKEGTYKCKFTLNVNSECIIDEQANAQINDSVATVTQAYNTITVEMNCEVKKPSIKWTNSSDWSKTELESALNNALIPQTLYNKDYTKSITRAEFAAVAVKLYERVAYKTASPVERNPFTDTNDVEVLKAYALGITNGTSATTFEPNSLITRQEMATMMVRSLTKAGINTTVNLAGVSKFSDHNKIDNWALDGVYFMSNIGIIKGVGNNTFDVFGNATREEALAISIRSVNKFK